MEMAQASKSSAAFDATLRARTEAEIQGAHFGGCADAIGVLPMLLRDYLAQKLTGSVEGIEQRLAQWLDEREHWRNAVKAATNATERQRLRTALAGKIDGLLEKLRGFKGDCPAASDVREHILNVLDDLLSIVEPELPAHMQRATCWYCDQDLTLHPSIEVELERAVKIAAWSGWPADLVRTKLRPVLGDGDAVLRSDWGAILIRRADGSLFAVRRLDG
jgi:hypothetical protein